MIAQIPLFSRAIQAFQVQPHHCFTSQTIFQPQSLNNSSSSYLNLQSHQSKRSFVLSQPLSSPFTRNIASESSLPPLRFFSTETQTTQTNQDPPRHPRRRPQPKRPWLPYALIAIGCSIPIFLFTRRMIIEHSQYNDETREALYQRRQDRLKKKKQESIQATSPATGGISISPDEVENLQPQIKEICQKNNVEYPIQEMRNISKRYILVGNSQAIHSAMLEILSTDPHADILIISSETMLPYNRRVIPTDLLRYPARATIEDLNASQSEKAEDELNFKIQIASVIRYATEDHPNEKIPLLLEPKHIYNILTAPDQLFDKPKPKQTGKRRPIDILLGHTLESFDPENKFITCLDSNGDPIQIYYDKILIAPNRTPILLDQDIYSSAPNAVQSIATFDDFCTVDQFLRSAQTAAASSSNSSKSLSTSVRPPKFLVVGSSLDATNTITSLICRGATVANALPLKDSVSSQKASPMINFFPEYLSDRVNQYFSTAGVKTYSSSIISVVPNPDFDPQQPFFFQNFGQYLVTFADGSTLDTDRVITCLGSSNEEAKEIAALGRLEYTQDDLVVCDSQLTAFRDVFFGSNTLQYFSQVNQNRQSYDLEDHDEESGLFVGSLMSEKNPHHSYTHLPKFELSFPPVFDANQQVVGGAQLAAVGRIDSELETVAFFSSASIDLETGKTDTLASVVEYADFDSAPPDPTLSKTSSQMPVGVVYYFDDSYRVVGILLWNNPERVARARLFLKSKPVFPPENREELVKFFPL